LSDMSIGLIKVPDTRDDVGDDRSRGAKATSIEAEQINSTSRDVSNVASISLVLNITLEGAELIHMGNDVLSSVELNNLVTDDREPGAVGDVDRSIGLYRSHSRVIDSKDVSNSRESAIRLTVVDQQVAGSVGKGSGSRSREKVKGHTNGLNLQLRSNTVVEGRALPDTVQLSQPYKGSRGFRSGHRSNQQ